MATIPRPEELLDKLLSENGDGTGNWNAIGDYSTTPGKMFYLSGPRGAFIRKFQCTMQAQGNIRPELYGSLPELTNGILWRIMKPDGAVAHAFAEINPVKLNAAWGVLCGDLKWWTTAGSSEEFIQATWEIPGTDGFYLPPGYSLEVALRDDFTGLSIHVFYIHGRFSAP